MKGPALLLLAAVLSGCFMPPADCRPYAATAWTDAAVYDGLVEAGAEQSGAGSGLPYQSSGLDEVWRAYRLRSVGWSDPLAPTEMRERSPDGAAIRQAGPGSSTVWFDLGIDARKGESEVRALFDLLARNVTSAKPAELDRLFSALLESRQESHILYPDDPESRQVMNHGYSAKARLPLRLDAFDAELRAAYPAEQEQIQIGEAVQRLGPWGFRFDLPVRTAQVEVGDVDVTLRTDSGGRGDAVARGVGNATAGHQAILAAFAELDIPPPAFTGPTAHFVAEGSGAGPSENEFPWGN